MARLKNTMLKPMAMKILKNEMEQLEKLKNESVSESLKKQLLSSTIKENYEIKEKLEIYIEEINDIDELKSELKKLIKK